MDIPLYKKGTGFTIGNPVSQAVAILFLSYLDHYIKEELKVPFYCRYCLWKVKYYVKLHELSK